INSNAELKNKLIQMAKTDPSPSVRAVALSALSDIPVNEAIPIYLNALQTEYSSSIISSALDGLFKHDKKMALEQAQKFETDKSKNIIMSILNIYAESGDEKYWEYFKKQFSAFSGFEMFRFVTVLNKYLKNINHSGTTMNAVKTIYAIYQSSDKMTSFALKRTLKEIEKKWTDKEKNLKDAISKSKQNNEPTQNLEDELKTVSETTKEIKTIISNL
ncbi:MAG: HEAT repeat domain-containing protein, partial [Bacteroidia bacterium]|nr:HEAT repeat domain-containing protein [Bacteroidia bacterium]